MVAVHESHTLGFDDFLDLGVCLNFVSFFFVSPALWLLRVCVFWEGGMFS
jgi:hypothetical protein